MEATQELLTPLHPVVSHSSRTRNHLTKRKKTKTMHRRFHAVTKLLLVTSPTLTKRSRFKFSQNTPNHSDAYTIVLGKNKEARSPAVVRHVATPPSDHASLIKHQTIQPVNFNGLS
ncbi:Hypothetical predicted protein [Paramuricea clavata]|uniref:Uncharacterized protein n=1 Tax=Paramuricea clavata TaxID=317549 RepID=A0A6S7G3X9_PARCT|nr:Hypothetical predicted protein [Paramuricea clavata]